VAQEWGFKQVTKSTAQISEVALKQMTDQQIITLEDGNYKIAK